MQFLVVCPPGEAAFSFEGTTIVSPPLQSFGGFELDAELPRFHSLAPG
jgi:hypothetical protein